MSAATEATTPGDRARTAVPDLLPVPDSGEVVEDLRRRCTDELRRRGVEGVELAPGTLPDLLLQLMVERDRRLRQRVNEAARAVLLPTATGADLDHLAARWGVTRLVVQPADDQASPPTTAVMEDDERLRRRVRLAIRGQADTGTEASYLFAALSAHGGLKDVRVHVRPDGVVQVSLLSIHGDGTGPRPYEDAETSLAHQAMQEAVQRAVSAVESVTDHCEVVWATPVPYRVQGTIHLQPGPPADDPAVTEAIRTRALGALQATARRNHRLGRSILREEFFAALSDPGVDRVELQDPVDQSLGLGQVPWVDPSLLLVISDGTDTLWIQTDVPHGGADG